MRGPKFFRYDEKLFVKFPWRKKIIAIQEEEEYFRLRTDRNRDLITAEEQRYYRSSRVGIAGLSVGSGIVHALVMTGGPKFLKLADFDILEVSNLNRMRAGIPDLGDRKARIAARQIWEVDPFAELEVWDKGVSPKSLGKFLLNPRLDYFIDEMDSLDLKLRARLICKGAGIPVLMCTDSGDSVILDIERYDTDEDLEPFFGRARGITLEKLADRKNWVKYSTQIIDPTLMPERLRESLLKLRNGELSGVPQLGSTASMSGAIMSMAIRRLSNGENIRSGRYLFDPSRLLNNKRRGQFYLPA